MFHNSWHSWSYDTGILYCKLRMANELYEIAPDNPQTWAQTLKLHVQCPHFLGFVFIGCTEFLRELLEIQNDIKVTKK